MSARFQTFWMSRLAAFLWGFVFVLLFRYALDNIYPFWASNLNLSFLAYLFVLVVWISFWFHFQFQKKVKKKKIIFLYAVGINTIIFLAVLFLLGEDGYRYGYPLFFTFQVLIHFFIFAAKLPFFVANRISLSAGILPGIVPLELTQNGYYIFLCGAFISLLPDQFLKEIKPDFLKKNEKLPILRESIDFIRFLFLGFSLFGIFDEYRERFYFTVLILILGTLFQYVLLRIEKKKYKLKYGIIVFSFFITALSLFYIFLPFHYAAAIGYVLLAFWEDIYFQKSTQGYLKREQIIIAIVLMITISAYFLTYSWVQILLPLLIGGVLIRVMIFTLKRFRPLFAVLFSAGILMWFFAGFTKFNSTLTREYFSEFVRRKPDINYPTVVSFLNFNKNASIITDIFSAEVIDKVSKKQDFFKSIKYREFASVFFTMNLNELKKEIEENQNTYFIFSLEKLYPYSTMKGFSELKNILREKELKNIFFVIDRKNENISDDFIYNKNFSILPEKISEDKKQFLFSFSTILADDYEAKSDFSKSLEIYESLVPYFENLDTLYKKLSLICGSLGKINEQIQYIEKYISITKKNTIEDKKQLLELYFWQNNKEKSNQWAETLIIEDSKNAVTYLKWIFKLMRDEERRYKWQNFYYKVRDTNVSKDSSDYKEKENLLKEIKEVIESQTYWFENIREEQKRQENIQFPEY
ncbi:MAG: hypothetical protein OEZ22_05320 [Spirochaetia bacterium]|nr:hypothetical protein [Spirochaetia bacterium]